MNIQVKREMDTLEGVDIFGDREDITLTPKETALFAVVASSLATARSWGSGQVSGGNGSREGAAERQALAESIRSKLRDIASIAQAMEEEGDVGVTEQFRLPARKSYAVLLATAESFAAEAQLMSAAFTERGLPATFVADLQALVTAFGVATGVKVTGGTDQVAGTAGLEAATTAGMSAVRTLRPIMRVHLQSNPALLAAWNSVSRVVRSHPAEGPEAPGTPTEPPTSGS